MVNRTGSLGDLVPHSRGSWAGQSPVNELEWIGGLVKPERRGLSCNLSSLAWKLLAVLEVLELLEMSLHELRERRLCG